ncbi:MAG: tRNA (adenosine(37)-N6)-dimethylallyltransferase MiaA [Cardiobacteriaceae bacterium]|nr:tRNA (adenosine(37)-N6)-dimethylallyltransferase MiaA [Cardiobacteriaceae bacterium]
MFNSSAHFPIICLLGPTAIGKSQLAFNLTDLLQDKFKLKTRIISVDAAQVYKYMDIGTAKPDFITQKKYPHHLINLIEPEENFSAADFARLANIEITEADKNGEIPLMVGGTMMYFSLFFCGMNNLPASNPELRQKLEAEFAVDGGNNLYQKLLAQDPKIAQKINPHDRQRILRFSELILLSNKTPSELFAAEKAISHEHSRAIFFACNCDRADLHERILERLQAMFAAGFIEEVTELYHRPNLTAEHSSMRSVGYRQIWQFLDGKIDKKTAEEQTLFATRQLAKRQITWLNNNLRKNLPEMTYINPLDKYEIAKFEKNICNLLENWK